MSKKKKIIILSVMVVLLLVTGFINVSLNNNLTIPTNTNASESFYSFYRRQRESLREQELQIFDSIIDSNTASAQSKENALEGKMQLADRMEQELLVEGIIRGKGFDDAIITISSTNVNVFVKTTELVAAEVAQISQVVVDQLGIEVDRVIVMASE